MCGLFGIINFDKRPVGLDESKRMLGILDHRGPDGSGYYHRDNVFLGHTRLSIIDLEGGWQPIYTEDGRYLVIFNGEIYNHEELRPSLIARGHRFKMAPGWYVPISLSRRPLPWGGTRWRV